MDLTRARSGGCPSIARVSRLRSSELFMCILRILLICGYAFTALIGPNRALSRLAERQSKHPVIEQRKDSRTAHLIGIAFRKHLLERTKKYSDFTQLVNPVPQDAGSLSNLPASTTPRPIERLLYLPRPRDPPGSLA